MSVFIHIKGENAAEAVKEFVTLSSHFVENPVTAAVSPTATSVTTEQPKRTRKPAEQSKPSADPETETPPQEHDADQSSDQEDEGDIPTVVEIRAKAQEVGSTPEAKKAIKALLDKFGSKSISDVPEGKRAAFMRELEVI